MITQSMKGFVAEHPNLKYVFFGGKGGVGKTVLAGAAALWFARNGKRTLLASTNPVHSLTSLLGQDVFGRHTPVSGARNLYAYEIDTRDTIERSKREIREKVEWFLRYAEIKTRADEFVESATMNPAFEESAMFENMIDLMFEDQYEVYVFDTAPTANARRLLGRLEAACRCNLGLAYLRQGRVGPGRAQLHEAVDLLPGSLYAQRARLALRRLEAEEPPQA